jgi:hypothetical protein
MIKWYAKARLDAGAKVTEVDVDFLVVALDFETAHEIAVDHIQKVLGVKNFQMVELRYMEPATTKEGVEEEEELSV